MFSNLPIPYSSACSGEVGRTQKQEWGPGSSWRYKGNDIRRKEWAPPGYPRYATCVTFSSNLCNNSPDQCCYLHVTERKIANPSPEVPSQGHDRQAGIALRFPTRPSLSAVTCHCRLSLDASAGKNLWGLQRVAQCLLGISGQVAFLLNDSGPCT